MRVRVGSLDNVNVCCLFRCVFFVKDVNCNMVDVFAEPRARAVVVLHYGCRVVHPRLPNLFNPYLYVREDKIGLFMRTVVNVFERFFPQTCPFNDSKVTFAFPGTAKGNVCSPVSRLSRSVLAPAFRVYVNAIACSVDSVLRKGKYPSYLYLYPGKR